MIDKFYSVKTNKGYIHRNIFKERTENIVDAVKFYCKEDAEHFIENIRKEREPKLVLVTCRYKVEEIKEDN